MTSAHDIAAYILDRCGSMTAMKLQKLVYYSQARALVLHGEPLFPEPVLAWAHGPVVYELFDHHRRQYVVTAPWTAGDPSALSELETVIVDEVLGEYGSLSADVLSQMTHAESPWRQARAGVTEGSRGYREIPLESIRDYYSRVWAA